MRVKVCGMTKLQQVRELEEAGVDFAGFIFYPKSPRFVIKSGLQPSDLKKERININRVGVFVNATAHEILRTVDEWRLHMVQLHGDESPKFCENISNHITTVKAFRMGAGDHVEWKINPYREVVDMFLFDAVGVGYGGTGLQFDWTMLEKAVIDKPYFLSGGIGPADVEAVKLFSRKNPEMFAVDVNSRFEVSPGIKDIDPIRQFTTELKQS